ncbi:MAG: lactonase family protein [Tannerellaceae bacterium]|jgi:6-phosphogluconolactonase (cycloisomerase 2 family)|nr:lactonase family protein [Tannerellaceae bacterium]
MDSVLYLLIGAYTLGISDGIYVYKFDMNTGQATYVSQVTVDNPSYIETGNGEFMYAVSENQDEEESCYANTLRFDKTKGELTLLNSQETFAASPCYIVADPQSKHVITANYAGGSLSVFPTHADTLMPVMQLVLFDGSGPDTTRQDMPHLHCVKISPDGNFLFAADLGSDMIYRYEINRMADSLFLKEESLKSFKLASESGPRHLTFHPNGKYLYIINELAGTVVGFNYNNGDLSEFQTVKADTEGGRASADIAIRPDGKFLYASNRNKNDGIAIFSINPDNGNLTKVAYQHTSLHPRNFTISPNGSFLIAACKDSDVVEIYAIDEQSGLLSKLDQDITNVEMPVCVKLVSR